MNPVGEIGGTDIQPLSEVLCFREVKAAGAKLMPNDESPEERAAHYNQMVEEIAELKRALARERDVRRAVNEALAKVLKRACRGSSDPANRRHCPEQSDEAKTTIDRGHALAGCNSCLNAFGELQASRVGIARPENRMRFRRDGNLYQLELIRTKPDRFVHLHSSMLSVP